AYDRERPLASGERRLLPALMRAAALRFWLSRLWDLHLPRDASLLTAHDPAHFERVLRQRVAVPWHPAPGPNLSPRPS
ncbi:MAG TPA: homoserine kinase, partial [Burkholderiaceae bacterium]